MGKIGYKHTDEALLKISLSSKNRKWTDYTNLKRSNALIGRKFSKDTLLKMSIAQKKRIIPIVVRRKISNSLKGEKSYLWKGGRSLLYEQIRKCYQYRYWRMSCFQRDQFTCCFCKDNTGGNLEVDHIEPFIKILRKYNIKDFQSALQCSQLWDIQNGRTLCNTCHRKTNTYGSKSK